MGWLKTSFGEVAEIITGNTPPKKESENYGIGVPWVKPPDLGTWEPIIKTEEYLSSMGQKKARLLPQGTVMVCCIGSIGKVGIAGTTLATNQQINSLVFDKSIVNSKFGYYYCLSIKHIFEAEARNAVVPILNKTNFSKIQIPLPPLSEQKRIVAILDRADELRKQRAEADTLSERILPALFIKMFGDPATNPMSWEVVNLGELCQKITTGSRGWSQYTGIGNCLFIRTQDVNNGEISDNPINVDPPDGTEAERTRLKDNDVVITMTGVVGKAAVFKQKEKAAYISQHVALVRTKKELNSYYLTGFANLPLGETPVLARFQYGQTKPGLGFRELQNAQIPLPPLELQEKYADYLNDLSNHRKQCFLSKQKIENLFQSLLYRAFSGDLTAQWREAHMTELLQEMEHQAKALNLQPSLF